MTVEVPNTAPAEPLVSVVTATYQHAAFIARNIAGVAAQQVRFPVEHLIGEDESTDGTRDICRHAAAEAPHRIRLFLRERKDVVYRMGRPTARANVTDLYTAARGRYIAVCPGDDHWIDAGKLQAQVDLMEQHPHWAGCFTNAWNVREEQRTDYLRSWLGGALPASETELRTLVRRNFIPSATFLFRRDILFPLPEAFFDAPVSDWVLVCHLARFGPMGYLDRHTAERTIHAGGIISQRDLLHKLEVNLLTLEHIGRMVGPSCADVVAQRTTELLDQALVEARSKGRWKEARDLWQRRIRHLALRPTLQERMRVALPAWFPGLARVYQRLRRN
ncbi:MAG: glycosyltransferase [Flavobacteriales bacterium]|nr:glycosyltransferase [Flavobacteriales bacterium]